MREPVQALKWFLREGPLQGRGAPLRLIPRLLGSSAWQPEVDASRVMASNWKHLTLYCNNNNNIALKSRAELQRSASDHEGMSKPPQLRFQAEPPGNNDRLHHLLQTNVHVLPIRTFKMAHAAFRPHAATPEGCFAVCSGFDSSVEEEFRTFPSRTRGITFIQANLLHY